MKIKMHNVVSLLVLALAFVVAANAGTNDDHKTLRAMVSGHQVVLGWNASTVPPGAAPVTSYNVYRSATAGTETLLASAGLATSYTDSTVTPGSTYYYKVSAVNPAGESGLSNEVGPLLIPNPVPPNPPGNLTGTAQ